MTQESVQRTHSLASCYENAITIVLRLQSMQQAGVSNSQAFRTSIRAALKSAMEQAKSFGYSSEANQLAFFAVVALLDESVLKLQNPAFADWAQRPLQEEMFGHNRAGEVFFEHLRALMAREDSQEPADCLEVYCLCMLLGFKGQYALISSTTSFGSGLPHIGKWGASGSGAEIRALVSQAREKIDRIRGSLTFLPDRGPVRETSRGAGVDKWSRGLGVAALVLFLIALLAYGGFWLQLSSSPQIG